MFTDTITLTVRSLKKWFRNPAAIMPGLFTAIFWLALFGSSFNPTNLIPSQIGGTALTPDMLAQVRSMILTQTFGGSPNYITFLTVGVIGLIVVINMAYGGIDIVLDRQLGYLNTLLAAPISRASIYFSGVLQNFVKAIVIAVLAFVAALVIPNGLQLAQGFGVLGLLGVFTAIALLAFGFCCMFTTVAFSVKTVDSLVAIINFIAFPVVFLSNAMFPTASFPDWMKTIAEVNPISKADEAARLLIVNSSLSTSQLGTFGRDMLFLGVFALASTVIGYLIARKALRTD